MTDNKSYLLFRQDTNSRVTRHGTKYQYHSMVSGLCDRSCRASVVVGSSLDEKQGVTLHSSAPVYTPRRDRRSFIEKIQALPNQSLWRTLQLDGDGEWIYHGLLRNSLIFMSDGSYNEALAPDVCSSASLILCRDRRERRQQLRGWRKVTPIRQIIIGLNFLAQLLFRFWSRLLLRTGMCAWICGHDLVVIITR